MKEWIFDEGETEEPVVDEEQNRQIIAQEHTRLMEKQAEQSAQGEKAFTTEMGALAKNPAAGKIHDLKLNLSNPVGGDPFGGTMTDENIDEAAALFDQLFDPDRIGSLRNFSVNGTQMTAYADEVAERIGFGHKVYSNNTKLEKGSFDEKFAKAVFLHAITNKKNKAEFSLHGKKVSLKIPAATKEQIRKAAHFRKETEQFKQEFQNIPEVEIPGFILLKQDIKNAGPEVLGLGFNSEERRNAAEDHFSVTKLKEENKAEYDRAVGLYDKIFGGIYEQKLSVAEGTTLLALKAQKQIEPRYLQFEVNGRRSSVSSISSNRELGCRSTDDYKVAAIYLLSRYDLSMVCLDGLKRHTFSKPVPEAPKSEINNEEAKVEDPKNEIENEVAENGELNEAEENGELNEAPENEEHREAPLKKEIPEEEEENLDDFSAEESKRYNNIKPCEKAAVRFLEKDLRKAKDEVFSFSFNSEKNIRNKKYKPDLTKLSKDEVDRAVALYDRIFGRYHKNVGKHLDTYRFIYNVHYGNAYDEYESTHPRYLLFNWKNPKTFLEEQGIQNASVDMQKVAAIYLLGRHPLRLQTTDYSGSATYEPLSGKEIKPEVEEKKPVQQAKEPAPEKKPVQQAKKPVEEKKPAQQAKKPAPEKKTAAEKKAVPKAKKPAEEKKAVPKAKKSAPVKTDADKYDDYMQRFTDPNLAVPDELMIKYLSLVLAAGALKKANVRFNEKSISKVSEHMQKIYTLDKLNDDKALLHHCLDSVEEALKTGELVRRKLYQVPKAQRKTYANEMKTLADSMMTTEGRSPEFKALGEAIRAAGMLPSKTAGMDPAEVPKAYRNANIIVVEAVGKYIKGKESLRGTEKGKERFRNAMDALAIAVKANPFLKARVDRLLNEINAKRDPADRINIETFTEDYGAGRAANAKAQREPKAAPKVKAKPNVKAKVMGK